MRKSTIVPTGIPRPFDDEEIIVSKTDPRGRITYVNDVFVRVSAFPEEDLLGRPHNVIRHPDMPRSVFGLLWETLGSGQELFAYVLNLAADGGHYWVLAHMTPTFGPDGSIVGYHSNRRTASDAAVAATAAVYAELVGIERAAADPVGGMAASRARLEAFLAERDQDWSQWVWELEVEAVAA